MAEIIRMPRLSDTMEEGNIISWLKKVGDAVSAGDVLAEVETDKATMDLESFFDGTLLYVGVEKGAVPVDEIIAIIGNKDEDVKKLLAEARGVAVVETESAPVTTDPVLTPVAHKEEAPPSTSNDSRIKASPLAKKIAEDNKVSLQQIQGSGDGGRIIKKDVEDQIKSGATSTTSVASAPNIVSGETIKVPLSQMRKTIAKRLSQSKFAAPHFYLTIEVNMNRAAEARQAVNNLGGVKVSFNDIVIKACAMALRKHTYINASWTDTDIVLNGNINIGVAVAVEEGLLVPVVKNADYKSLSQINTEVKDYAGRARDKKLKPEEMSGNTFTISNLGMFGIDEFTAIINPPDSCILAVGSIVEKPIVENGAIKVASIMKVTLSCDHRVVDGAKGAEFLNTLRNYLENPLTMLV